MKIRFERIVMFLQAKVRRLLNKHRVVVFVSGPYRGIGDGYDIFGECIHCGKICTKDTHWTGDDNWYSVDKT